MTHAIESAAYAAEDGAGWTTLGQPLTAEEARDPKLIAAKLNLLWTVEANPIYRRDKYGNYVQIPDYAAQTRSDTGDALSITSDNRYHTTNRQPMDVLEAFRDDFAKQSLRMTHAASLMGGSLIVCAAVMPKEFDIVVGKGDRLQSFVTLSTGYDKKHGTKATKGTIRVVCWNTLMASIYAAMKQRTIKTVRASTELEFDTLKGLIDKVRDLHAEERVRYTELANREVGDAELLRYFADVLEIRVEDLGKVDRNGDKLVSTKSENMLTALKTAYVSGRGAAVAHGSMWGALNAVTHYATWDKTVRDMQGDGKNSAKVTSNLFGDAGRLKARALELALKRANSQVLVAA